MMAKSKAIVSTLETDAKKIPKLLEALNLGKDLKDLKDDIKTLIRHIDPEVVKEKEIEKIKRENLSQYYRSLQKTLNQYFIFGMTVSNERLILNTGSLTTKGMIIGGNLVPIPMVGLVLENVANCLELKHGLDMRAHGRKLWDSVYSRSHAEELVEHVARKVTLKHSPCLKDSKEDQSLMAELVAAKLINYIENQNPLKDTALSDKMIEGADDIHMEALVKQYHGKWITKVKKLAAHYGKKIENISEVVADKLKRTPTQTHATLGL